MSEEIQRWVDPAMYAAEPIKDNRPRVYLLSATPDPLGAIAAASLTYEGKVCDDPRTLSDDQRREYWKEANKTHLTAPLEYVDFQFLIEGVTRAFRHQLVRQRTAVYAQESQRFAVKMNLADEVSMPPSLQQMVANQDPSCQDEPGEVQIWNDTVAAIEKGYEELIDLGIPAEDARGLLPTNIQTRIHYKTNLRNLVDQAGNRLCTQAQFEWRLVFTELVQAIRGGIGLQYGQKPDPAVQGETAKRVWTPSQWQFEEMANSDLFKPVCYAKGKCPFGAKYDRSCTIQPRVEEGRFDEIDPAEWLLDPAAARRGV